MGAIWHDVKYAARRLARSRGFAVVAIASLALGIGANTAFFSLLNAIVLRELPVWRPNQLVEIKDLEARTGQAERLNLPMYEGLARSQKVFSQFCGELEGDELDVQANGWLGRADVSLVSGEFYSMLRVRPAIGRLIEPSDVNLLQAAPRDVAVLGYSFWQRRFGGDPAAIGKTVNVQGVPFTVIGVAPEGFQGTSIDREPEVTIPLSAGPLVMSEVFRQMNPRHFLWITAIGRLKPGVSLPQARADLTTVWPAILKTSLPPDETRSGRANFLARRLLVRSDAKGDDNSIRDKFTRPLEILIGISGLILLLACANLAGLMLAQAAARDQEMGVRIALGAGRGRVVRQVIFEGLFLSLLGAFAAVGFAWAGSRALVAAITANYAVAPTIDLRPDTRVLAFTVALAVLTGVLFSLAPAWRATRQNPAEALHSGPRTAGGTGRLGRLMVVTQLALAVVLLSCAGLLVRSLIELMSVNVGYRSHDVLSANLAPRPGDGAALNNGTYGRRLLRRVDSLPGVVSVAVGDPAPGSGAQSSWPVAPAGSAPGTGVLASLADISPGFFRTLGMTIISGRDFTWEDAPRTQRVVIVSRSLAQRLFPSGQALGRLIRVGPFPKLQKAKIVGIVNDARLFNSRDPNTLFVYDAIPQEENFDRRATLEVRVSQPPTSLAAPVRRAINAAGHEYALSQRPLDEVREQTASGERITALLSGFFSGLGLLLAAIGLFGLVSYNVTRRTREIGIRMALGADAAVVRGMVLREAAALAVIGLGLGLAGALAASRLVAGMLFGVSPHDAATIVTVSVIFFAVALLAGYLPARRAMRIDPQEALRSL